MAASPEPEFRGGSVIATAVATVSLAAVFVLLRFVSRGGVVRALGPSDWVILAALVLSIGNSVATILEVTAGATGRHIDTAPLDRIVNGSKAGYSATIIYVACLVAVKFSILLLYLRILSQPALHRVCYVVFALVGSLGFYSLVSNILTCVPVAAFWDHTSYPDAWCFPGPQKWWSDVIIHILTELMILCLPARFVYNLRIPPTQKWGLYALFAFGAVVCIVSLLRLPSMIAFSHSQDPTWDSATVAIWSCVELNMAIICACCMTLRPLAARLFPRAFRSGYYQRRLRGAGEERRRGFGRARFSSEDELPVRAGPHPPTVGSRKERPINDPLSLENIDQMPESPPPTARSRPESELQDANASAAELVHAAGRASRGQGGIPIQ